MSRAERRERRTLRRTLGVLATGEPGRGMTYEQAVEYLAARVRRVREEANRARGPGRDLRTPAEADQAVAEWAVAVAEARPRHRETMGPSRGQWPLSRPVTGTKRNRQIARQNE